MAVGPPPIMDEAKIIGFLVGAAALIAVGFGSAEIYEHKVPWGLKHQLTTLTNSLPKRDRESEARGAKAQAASDAPAFTKWDQDLQACRANLTTARNDAAKAQARADAFTSKQASAAYALGRASCPKVNDAPSPSDRPDGLRPAISLPDTADDFARLVAAGAFTGSR